MSNLALIQELLEQLTEANRQISETARPLDRLDELDFEQRRQLAAKLRAALQRWESTTEQISHVLAQS